MSTGKRYKRGRGVNGKGRSKTEQFVKLNLYMLKSDAWQALGLPARALLVEILQRYNGNNNGYISFSVREAATLMPIGQNTASKAFRELQEKGLLKARVKGSFSQKTRHATEWIITDRPYPNESGACSKEFMRWREGDNFFVGTPNEY